MPEVTMEVKGFNVLKVRLDPTDVYGQDMAGQPCLCLPLKLQLLPAAGPQLQQTTTAQYVLVRLTGTASSNRVGEFATFDSGPLAEPSNPSPFERHQEVKVQLDRTRVKRYEDARAGSDASLTLSFSALVWFPNIPSSIDVVRAYRLEIAVPKSHWVERVIGPWGLDSIELFEIRFPSSAVGENFRTSYQRLKAAEKLFVSGLYKQVLTELRQGFEALATSLGYEKRVKECFESLFADSHPDKKEKAREALNGLYRFLHLGPHDQADAAETKNQPPIVRSDARFALIMAHAIFEYITPQS
jgi:hypothetical protein